MEEVSLYVRSGQKRTGGNKGGGTQGGELRKGGLVSKMEPCKTVRNHRGQRRCRQGKRGLYKRKSGILVVGGLGVCAQGGGGPGSGSMLGREGGKAQALVKRIKGRGSECNLGGAKRGGGR